MAYFTPPIQGVLDISNVQGNYFPVLLEFKDGNTNAIDLTQFTEIVMQIKGKYDVNYPALITFTIGSGLVISGTSNEKLSFILDTYFWSSQTKNWVYDITFVKSATESYTFIKGSITNVLTASKPTS
jgi:hypothetical protein|tara:strand:- start:311 stop:691 length:381 start_codon:yes stop_codon:yes gene_type:complete